MLVFSVPMISVTRKRIPTLGWMGDRTALTTRMMARLADAMTANSTRLVSGDSVEVNSFEFVDVEGFAGGVFQEIADEVPYVCGKACALVKEVLAGQ